MKQRIILTVRDGYRFGFGMVLAHIFWIYLLLSIPALLILLIILF